LGQGNFSIDNKKDYINYEILNKNNSYNFISSINFENNPITIKFLNYKKNVKKNLLLNINLSHKKNKEIIFNEISIKNYKNTFLLNNLKLNKNLKFKSVQSIQLNYINENQLLNKISIIRNKNNYKINAESLDISKIVAKMLQSSSDNKIENFLYNFNSNVSVNIDKAYLDKISFLSELNGNILFKKNIIHKLKIDSKFSSNKKLNLTINTNGDEKITTLFSDYAKPIVQNYKFIKGFDEGVLDFYSIKKKNISNSKLRIYDFKLNELPALTKLLTLASLQGIADLLTGEGIRFNDFEMDFSNQGKLLTINELYAIGPAISILMDGYVETDRLVSLRGTLVPATTLNNIIGSIPYIGKILVGKKIGEGVFGVSFKIKGPHKKLKTTVNPIKTLTPRFITRTLEKIKKNN
jgi:hypothetical protein